MKLVPIALILAATLSSAWAEEGEGGVKPGDLEAKVKVEEAKEGELPIRLHAIGTITSLPEQASSLVAIVGGVVAKVCVADGQTVEANAPVVMLDDRPMKEALSKANAALRSAQGDLTLAEDNGLNAEQAGLDLAAAQASVDSAKAQKEADSQAGLLKEGLTSANVAAAAHQAAEAAAQAAKVAADKARYFKEKGRAAEQVKLEAAVDTAKADVETAKRALSAATLCAPRAGRVSGLSVSAGQMLDAGKIVAVVIGEAGFAVRFSLSPASVDKASLGAKAELPGRDIAGKVCSVGGGIDPDTGLIPVIVALEKCDHAPRIGETVFVDIDTDTPRKGLLVPVSALVFEDGEAKVFVVDKASIAHEVKVEAQARNAKFAVIKGEGVSEGANVIVDGNYNLPDGAKVEIEKKEEPEKAGPPEKTTEPEKDEK